MPNNVLFWTFFGCATRFWQLGLERRPLFNRGSLWVWPIFAGTGASFGYWLEGVEQRQTATLQERKDRLLEMRARRDARKAAGEAV